MLHSSVSRRDEVDEIVFVCLFFFGGGELSEIQCLILQQNMLKYIRIYQHNW